MWILISFIIFNILMKILNRPKTTSSGRIIYFCQSFISPQTYPWPLLRPCIWEQEDIFVDSSFVQGGIHRIPCGHEVIITTNFRKRLDLWPLGSFLFAHSSCHFAEIAINPSHQSTTFPSFMNLPISAATMDTHLKCMILNLKCTQLI